MSLAADSSPEVRCSALASLVDYPSREDVFRTLLEALKDPHASVRVSALSALGYFGDARALSHIAALSNDPEERVQRFVTHATEQLKGRDGVRP
jgi:HEAT repeat protein